MTNNHSRLTLNKGFWISFFISFLIIILLGFVFDKFTIGDDAYITYRYSQNLANGNGPVWNVGEKVEGYTSFLHMILNAGAITLGLEPENFSQGLGILSLVLICTLGWMRLEATNSKYKRNWQIAFLIYIASSPTLLCWGYFGLETLFFSFLIFSLALLLEWEIRNEKLPVGTAILAFLVAITRPEGPAFAILAVIATLVWNKKKPLKNFLALSIIAGIPFAIYFSWRYSYFGWFFPNTYYAKVGHTSFSILLRGLKYALRYSIKFGLPFVALILFFRLIKKWRTFDIGAKIYLLFFGCGLLMIVIEGGDHMPYGRFFAPLLPFAFFSITVLSEYLFTLNAADGSGKKGRIINFLVRSKVTIIVTVLVINFLNPLMLIDHLRKNLLTNWNANWREIGKALKVNTPSDAVLAAVAIGGMGYFSERTFIDMLGLTDVKIAHSNVATGRGLPGHEKYNTPYLLKRRPSVILVCSGIFNSPASELSCLCPAKLVKPKSAIPDLLNNVKFSKLYVFSNMKIEDKYLSAFLRRDLLNKEGYEKWVPADDVGQKCDKNFLKKFNNLRTGKN